MRGTVVAIAALALVAGGCGGDAELDVADAWSRPAIGPNGAVYLTIDGAETDTALSGVSASTDVAAMVELHQTVLRDDGAMGMTQISDVEIPARSTVMMVPGGLHVMCIGFAEPFRKGEQLDLTITLESTGTITVTAPVENR